ncbi:helix-turn-helix domain-containing protein [Paenibacillus taichungensis]
MDYNQVDIANRQTYNKTSSHALFVVTGGQGSIDSLDNRHTRLEKGMIMFVPAGRTIVIEGSCELQYYKIELMVAEVKEDKASRLSITGETVQHEPPAFISDPDRLPLIELNYSPWSSCLKSLEQILHGLTAQDWLDQWEIQLRFQEWFRVLLRQNDPEIESSDDRARLQSSIRYIREHYDQPITVDDLAAEIRLTRSSYTRQFKEITGKLPLDYVNAVRLEHSKLLLQMTDDRLHDIAQNVGFNNEYYFGRRFKQYTGVSPGLYRRHHRQEVRVFAPYLEDFVLALGIKPILQTSHRSWGRQQYLGLEDVPDFDVTQLDIGFNETNVPEFIMLNNGYQRWNLERFEQIAPTFYMEHEGEDWRSILKSTADILGKVNRVQDVIGAYEDKAVEAKGQLARHARGQTVALLRITSSEIILYGNQYGYVGPVLYQDLGLTPHFRVQQWASQSRRVGIGLEQLSQLEADHLFITFDNMDSAYPGEERKLLERDEWRRLPAVISGHVYEVDFMTWMNYGVISHGKKIDDILQYLG